MSYRAVKSHNNTYTNTYTTYCYTISGYLDLYHQLLYLKANQLYIFKLYCKITNCHTSVQCTHAWDIKSNNSRLTAQFH